MHGRATCNLAMNGQAALQKKSLNLSMYIAQGTAGICRLTPGSKCLFKYRYAVSLVICCSEYINFELGTLHISII